MASDRHRRNTIMFLYDVRRLVRILFDFRIYQIPSARLAPPPDPRERLPKDKRVVYDTSSLFENQRAFQTRTITIIVCLEKM